MIRVGIEASFLDLQYSGIRTYLEALTRTVPVVANGIELVPLTPKQTRQNVQSSRRFRRLGRFKWEAFELARQADVADIDLLHVPHLSMPLRTKTPVVVTVHDVIPFAFDAYRQSRAMRAYLEYVRRRIPSAEAVIVPSYYVASELEDVLDVEPDRVNVIPMGVDMALLDVGFRHLSRPYDMRESLHPYVFNIAGFDVRKNLRVLLEAFSSFRRAGHEEWKLVIAGEPHSDNRTIYPPIRPEIRRLGLEAAVELPGRVSEAKRLDYFRGASMYVSPSLAEGFGLTCLEAMACGVPTIGSNRGSLPEVIEDGGLIVDPSTEAVAHAMVAVAGNSSLRKALQTRGWVRASQYTWDRTARSTVALYHDLVNHPSSASHPL